MTATCFDILCKNPPKIMIKGNRSEEEVPCSCPIHSWLFLQKEQTGVTVVVEFDFIFPKHISWLRTPWALPRTFMKASKSLQRQQF